MSKIKQVSCKIFLAEQRGCTKTDCFRSLHTFNDGDYRHPDRGPLGILQVFNEDTLAGGHFITLQARPDEQIILIPLVGGVQFDQQQHSFFIEAGSLFAFRAAEHSACTITNPYDGELVSYLHIRLAAGAPNPLTAEPEHVFFDLDKSKNGLVHLLPSRAGQPRFSLLAGKFDGRKDAVYPLREPENTLFVFVIDGAFEVQNRLLHPRDGLSLSGLDELELEALSNDALVVVMEITG